VKRLLQILLAIAVLKELRNLPRPAPTVANAHRRRPAIQPDDFKNLFLLLVSLLHGNIFIALVEHSLVLSDKERTGVFWTTGFFNLSIFFRIIQSQIAAATKYAQQWRVGAFDFVVVFLTAMFEYALFTYDRFEWASPETRKWMIGVFAAFGIVGTP